ncbi:MAG: hypothetical protein ACRDD1_08250, partial [Planctomycetia bacterium]
TTAAVRGELLGLAVLVWSFSLVGLVVYQLTNGRFALRAIEGPEVFDCLVAAMLSGVFLGAVGLPWTAGRRLRWLAAVGVAAFLFAFPWSSYTPVETDAPALFEHVFNRYDGPKT